MQEVQLGFWGVPLNFRIGSKQVGKLKAAASSNDEDIF